jgi:hypothetical protein
VTVTVAAPFAFAAGAKLNVPSAATVGGDAKSCVFVVLVENVTDWSASPAEIEVAHPATEVVPESSSTVSLGPAWKLGAVFTGGGGGGGAGTGRDVVVGAGGGAGVGAGRGVVVVV